MDFRFDIVWGYAPLLLKGTGLTVGISFVSIWLGAILGLGIGFGKMSRKSWISWPVSAYVNFFRGTPLIVQALIVHYIVIPPILGTTNAIVAGIVTLSLNSAAYTAEIYRAGIQSIDRGQREAAYSLGMTPGQAMRFVILPQAVKRMIPAFGNEFIVLVKDSAMLAYIAVPELMYWSNAMKGQYLKVVEAYTTAALVYFILTYSLSKLLQFVERRL
ncbi:amino acid ABC transporter permease [Cohnella thermotolerans]|jgi:glutamine transport system permease protein|uniref:amino acid ABC transporter permease n=1 Tax=Cohnella thermotolerans TaxID=329858 RepID=UPI0004249B44|nr:amino acid ABC transporter permease [Cohnella thermotolerans]